MNYARTNEPENDNGLTILDPAAMEASVSEYMQSDEFKAKVAGKQETKMFNIHDKVQVTTKGSAWYQQCGFVKSIFNNTAEVVFSDGRDVNFFFGELQPAASTPARLEDLAPMLMDELIALKNNPSRGIYNAAVRPLQEMDLITLDYGSSIITERGAALVSDYQRRQGEAAKVCPRCHGDEFVDYRGLFGEGEPQRIPCPVCQKRKSQSNLEITKGIAEENARLQAELAAVKQERDTLAMKKRELWELLTDIELQCDNFAYMPMSAEEHDYAADVSEMLGNLGDSIRNQQSK